MGVRGLERRLAAAPPHRRADGPALHPPQARRHPDLRGVRRRRPRHRGQGHPARAAAGRLRAGGPRLRLLPAGGGRAAELWERDDPAKWSWVRVATKYPTLTEQLLLRPRHPGRDRPPRRLDRAGAAGRTGRAHRGSRPVGRDPAGQRPGRGRRDHDARRRGSSSTAPRSRPRTRAVNALIDVDAPGSRARRSEAAAMIRRLDTARARGSTGVVRGARPLARRRSTPPSTGASTRSWPRVRDKGDAALLELTERFDRVSLTRGRARGDARPSSRRPSARSATRRVRVAPLRRRAHRALSRGVRAALLEHDGRATARGSARKCGRSIASAVYVPGGRAAYPSTVLMTAIPARVAGVREIVLVSPPAADKSLERRRARRRAHRRRDRGLPDRRGAGGRRAGLRHRDHPPRGQDRGARATSTWRSPRAGSSATSAST